MTSRSNRQHVPERKLWSTDYLAMNPLSKTIYKYSDYISGAVLDIGCGHQPYNHFFQKNITRYIGLDYDFIDASPDVVGNALCLPFSADQFDTVISFQVLEHLPNPFKTFEEIFRVLKPNGKLILTAPQSWRKHEKPHDYFRFTNFGLSYLCNHSGLSPITIQSVGYAWAHLGQSFLITLFQSHLFRRISFLKLHSAISLIINVICSSLDHIWFNEDEVMNHILIAEKG